MRILKLTKLFKLEYVNKLLRYYNSFVIIKLCMNVINL
jgi:translation initiation factor 2 beta subunit (eIF-2beta)/eIF-5